MLPSTQQRTNGQTDVKQHNYMSITYLDVTCAESGMEPPFSQMSSTETTTERCNTCRPHQGPMTLCLQNVVIRVVLTKDQ